MLEGELTMGVGQGATVLVATRVQLERQIKVLRSKLGEHAVHQHPHPRVRHGVFGKTFGKTLSELAVAIQSLAASPKHEQAPTGHTSSLQQVTVSCQA